MIKFCRRSSSYEERPDNISTSNEWYMVIFSRDTSLKGLIKFVEEFAKGLRYTQKYCTRDDKCKIAATGKVEITRPTVVYKRKHSDIVVMLVPRIL